MGAGTWESHHAITALMFRYAEMIDAADFEGIGALFARGRITGRGMPGAIEGAEAVRDLYAGTNRVHPDGTLRTRHLTTNVLTDIDEESGTATARSSFLVLQATSELAFQPIVAGRYHDRFGRTDAEWHFVEREMRVEQVGDVREHLRIDLGEMIPSGDC
ncbi:MAG: nuclear transport factor 2 family protein [Actinobacteria bacterium]|nr:nuclear transport factor 2 family protein [Actinomycetota bacterium]